MYILPPNTVAGSVTFQRYLDITKDIVVSFDYACYGPSKNGSEGFCVFFYDTFAPNAQGGGPGPGLAYSSVYNVDVTGIPIYNRNNSKGLQGGRLGVGFDISGNFGNNTFFNSGLDSITPNSIALRSNSDSDFDFITNTLNLNNRAYPKNVSLYQQLTAGQAPDFKRIRVRLTDFGQRVIVDIKSPSDLIFTNYLDYSFTNYNNSLLSSTAVTINGFPLSSVPVNYTPTIRCGIGFSTGEVVDTIFKIRNFNINGVFTTYATQDIFTYDIDSPSLSSNATLTYTNAKHIFYSYDTLNILNNYDGHTTVNPVVTAGQPLIEVQPADPGAPYTSGDRYVSVTSHA
jgi:hypothetical protein